MEQLITQVKYIEKGAGPRKGSALCTLEDEVTHSWNCKFEKMSLAEIAQFIVDFFDSTSITAEILTFKVFKKEVRIYKSSSKHNYQHYLEELCSKIIVIVIE